MRHVPYAVVNVFSTSPLKGNPIAVVPDVMDLHETEMRQLAREFNLSLTVFIDRAKDGESLARLRFFTPEKERMFSGKGCLAAWKPFFEMGYIDLPVALADGLVQEKEDSLSFTAQSWEHKTPVTVIRRGEVVESVSVKMPTPEIQETFEDLAMMAEVLGISEDKLADTGLRPQLVVSGGGKIYTAVPKNADLESLSVSSQAMRRHYTRPNCEGVYVFSLESAQSDHPLQGRGFYPITGVFEDSASGSAVAGLLSYLKANGIIDCKRDSMIRVQQKSGLINASCAPGDSGTEVKITGSVTISRRGTFDLP